METRLARSPEIIQCLIYTSLRHNLISHQYSCFLFETSLPYHLTRNLENRSCTSNLQVNEIFDAIVTVNFLFFRAKSNTFIWKDIYDMSRREVRYRRRIRIAPS